MRRVIVFLLLVLAFLFAPFAASVSASSNLVSGLTASVSHTFAGLAFVTDGLVNSNYADDCCASGGLSWLSFDMGAVYQVNDVKLWHYYADGRTYRDVIIQLSTSSDFSTGVTIVYNNDTNNSAGLGAGSNSEYAENSGGLDVPVSNVLARYVKVWSNGSSANAYNHYTEFQVWGDPPPTDTPSPTVTFTPSFTPTVTFTFTPSFTPTDTPTFTPTFTPSFTPTDTPTFTPTFTPSFTPTDTPTFTPTFTPTLTFTPTNTLTPTNTPVVSVGDFSEACITGVNPLLALPIAILSPVTGIAFLLVSLLTYSGNCYDLAGSGTSLMIGNILFFVFLIFALYLFIRRLSRG